MMQMMLVMSPGYQSQRYVNTQMNTGMRMNNHADRWPNTLDHVVHPIYITFTHTHSSPNNRFYSEY